MGNLGLRIRRMHKPAFYGVRGGIISFIRIPHHSRYPYSRLWVICLLITICQIPLSSGEGINARGDRLVHVTSDRPAGTWTQSNGHGDRASVLIRWHSAVVAQNGRGDMLIFDPVPIKQGNYVRSWYLHQ